jgi:protoporphyrinogen oxidase
MPTTRVAVIGGGIAGAAAALRLSQAGAEVVLCERSPALGGLVVSFEVGGTPLECFYHHVFPHETHIIDLIHELGLGDRLGWYRSSVGVFTGGRVWPFTSATDLLRFRPLPALDRLRAGIGALRMGRVSDWEGLDNVAAADWLTRHTSPRVSEKVWVPLLRAKFGPAAPSVPAAWIWARFHQRAGGRKQGGERLGYLRGGFKQLFDSMAGSLASQGVDVRCSTTVDRVLLDDDDVARGVVANGAEVETDAVIYAGTLPDLGALVPPSKRDPRWSEIGGLGVLCVIFELRRAVNPVYWTNVCDASLPFGGVIEHTNLLPPSDYGGRHVMYVSRYFTSDEPLATADPAAEAKAWSTLLHEGWPGFSETDVLAVHPFRARYAAPLVRVGSRQLIPPMVSHLQGLIVCTTAQINPQDRGMSDGVRIGSAAASAALRAARSAFAA